MNTYLIAGAVVLFGLFSWGIFKALKKANFCPLETYRALTSDESGKPSLSKTTVFWGFISMSIWMHKLVVQDQMSPEYFMIYGALFVAHNFGSKYLDAWKEKGK